MDKPQPSQDAISGTSLVASLFDKALMAKQLK
jgi:hypothetical protein